MQGRGEKTRRKLLNAATAVFAKRGYHAARVIDIVKAAKTSQGTFYLYFDNKEDLFAVLAGEVSKKVADLVADFPSFGADDAGRQELETWLVRFGDLYQEHGSVIRAWTDAEIAGERVGDFGSEASAKFALSIAELFSAARTPEIDPQVASLAIVAMIERSHYYLLTSQLKVDRAEMAATLARSTHAAIYG